MQSSSMEQSRSLFAVLGQWWRNWKSSRARITELSNFTSHELHDVARDAGVATEELKALAGKWPGSADLLSRRMAALGLDAAELARSEPITSYDLKKSCSLCASKRRCEHDLVKDSTNPIWNEYCLNSGRLSALCEEQIKLEPYRRAWQVAHRR